LADELRRVKRGEPTIARPLKRSEQGVRWIRRRPLVAAFAAATLISVITTLFGGAWYSYRLADSLAETQQALARAKESEQHSAYLLYAADMKLAGEALARHDTSQVKQLLHRHMPETGKEDTRNFIWHYLSRIIHEEPIESTKVESNVYCQAVSSDGRLLVMGDASGKIHLYDTDPFRVVGQIDSGQVEVNGVAVNASGDRIATAGKDGTVKIWNRGESTPAHTVPACTKGQAYAVAFVRSGDVVVTGGEDPALRFWSAVDGRLLKEIVGDHVDSIESIGASPNGKTMVAVDSRANIKVYDSMTFKRLGSRHADLIGRASVTRYSPDGKRIAVIGSGTGVLLLDAIGNPDSYVSVSAHRKEAIAWNEDGSKLFVGERSGAVHVFSVPKFAISRPVEQGRLDDPARLPKLINSWQAHPGRIWSLAYVPKTKQLISTSDKGDMVRWDLRSSTGWTPVPPSDKHGAKQSYHFSRDGKTVMYNDPSRCARVNPGTLEFMKSTKHDSFAYTSTALDPSGRLIAFARYGLDLPVDARILIHRTDDLSEVVRWDIPSFKGDIQVAFSKDAKYLGAAFERGINTFHLLDAQTLKSVKHVSFSNLGMKLNSTANVAGHECFIVEDQNEIIALHCHDLAVLWRFEAHHFGVAATILSPDGRVLYTAGGDGLIKSWDLSTRQLRHVFSGEHLGVTKLSMSSDNQVLVSLVAGENQLRVWDCRTYQQVTSIKAPGNVPIANVHFMPDGRRLIVLREEDGAFVLDTQ
jgi:WD40 repeat protein